jgi:NitT/TauT family transport system permease protein
MILFGYRVPMMASLLVWAALWEIVGQANINFMIPPLSAVFASGWAMVHTDSWLNATVITLRSFGLGMALAVAVGVPVGVLMGRVVVADRLLGLWVNIFVSAPLSAIVPVLMILFGIGETTVVVSVFLFAVWIIVLDTRAGVLHIPRSLEEMALSYGASRWELYTKVVFWAALPEILAGIRIGVIRGVKGVVVGQLLVSIIGYGELFELYSRGFEMTYFWALTLILFAAAMLLSSLVELFERKIQYYAGAR